MSSAPTAVPSSSLRFDSVESSIEAFARGEFLVVLDSQHRENEGDLIIAAQDITTEQMAFMVRHTSGLICAPVKAELASSLLLPQMVAKSEDLNGTAYTISIDSADPSISTGISAHDRALTCRTLASPKVHAGSFHRPGHVFPLRAREGGVRQRTGHTEAAVEFCRLAGKPGVGVLCELIEDGEEIPGRAERTSPGMMSRDGCLRFGKRWGLKVCTIEDLVDYVERTEGKLVLPVVPANTNGVLTNGVTNGVH